MNLVSPRIQELRRQLRTAYPGKDIDRPRGSVLCVEGFPRSANSFLVRALVISNPGAIEMDDLAHHTHDARNLELACQLDIPALALIREPEAAIASAHVYMGLPLSDLVSRHLAFYRRMWPLQTRILVADFRTVIDNFFVVVAQLNARYGTSFAVSDNLDEVRNKVFAETMSKGLSHHKGNYARKAGIQDERREEEKALVIGALQKMPEFDLCRQIYRQVQKACILGLPR